MPPKTRKPIDLNILPARYRLQTISPAILVAWTLSAVLLILTLSSVIATRSNRSQIDNLSGELAQAQRTLQAARTPAPQVAALMDELSQTLQVLNVLQGIQPTIVAGRRDWQGIARAILAYDQNRISLTALSQDGDELILMGMAQAQEDVLSYTNTLDESGLFDQVLVEHLGYLTPITTPSLPGQATLTPGPNVTPTTATPPPNLYDSYEVDDFQPTAIAVGEEQWHNFNPVYDADQVVFQGKAGRHYCILAIPQSPGIDTYLEVSAGGVGYTNDDCLPGNPASLPCQCPASPVTSSHASLVEIQISPDRDEQVYVKVTNRGQYGPDKWYTLRLEEIAGDPWETDDLTPKPIAIGETQARTFYPNGDVDRVTFAAKAGHAYEVRTTNLSAGVDTVISAIVNGQIRQNDDVGAGDRSSRVVLEPTVDGIASVTVTNKGLFGPTQSYTLQVREMGGDDYEPDDLNPHVILLWEHQLHSFFPTNDVDRVDFAIQAGHTYEIRTYNLAAEANTVITVLVHGQTYKNDDVSPGDRSSRVVFTAAANGRAGAAITNVGQYGVNSTYWLTLSELTSTATPTASPSPTATPDCQDPYEPDDHVARLIAVGEQQTHSFCPSGDVDRAAFTAKAGYAYQVETADLALGVDTYLTVQLGAVTMANDDRSSQDLGSQVQIQNLTGSDAPAFILVTNKGLFGQNRTYRLRVSAVGAGDAYEVDDASPVPIAIGSAQQRTFYPPGDVDRVTFVARTGHQYRIYTSNLAAAVDTALSVDMGTTHLTNDNRAPGDLSSYIELQNPSTSDYTAFILVTNNGQYRPDASYTLQVDDLGTISGDEYEPDTDTKRYIAVNQIQHHTFYPNLDIDRVILNVKNGRRYVVMTCGNGDAPPASITSTEPFSPTLLQCSELTPGVDTVLIVNGPIANCKPGTCQNDDALPGSGYLNSRVEFDALANGEVTIMIYNKGFFGPTMDYFLRAMEIGLVPPTPSATPSPFSSPTPTLTGTPMPPSQTPSPTPSITPSIPPPSATTSTGKEAKLFPTEQGHRIYPGLASWAKPQAAPHQFVQQAGQYAVEFTLLLRLKAAVP